MENKEKLCSVTLASIIFVLIFSIYILSTASAKEITVDDDSGADFKSIQEAVNSSLPGDQIIVRSGVYNENVIVNVTRLTLRSESKNSNVLVKSPDRNKSVFLVKASNVTLSGFNITGTEGDYVTYGGDYVKYLAGICLENVSNCRITGNTLFENQLGVCLIKANNNTISENFLFNDSISLGEGSSWNNLTGNTIERGYISLSAWSSRNLISKNKISNGIGISFACCGGGDVVSDNTIFNCSVAISAYDRGVDIRNNTIAYCGYGISISQSLGTGIYDNKILNCTIGINLDDTCSLIAILNNTITFSTECGVNIPHENGMFTEHRIFNNYFNNTINANLGTYGGDIWNISRTSGTNVVGGPYLGGNFWAKPDGTGFSQICGDSNEDGIGDLPYNINENYTDYFPIVPVSRSKEPVIPVVNFSTNISRGFAPLSVRFTDYSQNALLWSWDFENDGVSDSTEKDPAYIYKIPGNYTVNLTLSNGNDNNASKIREIIVQDPKDLPVADFSTNVTSGYAPLAVQFTDLSQNSIGRSWDFNNDWQGDTGDAAQVYVFTEPGSYNVNLVAINGNGTATKTTTITVLEESSSSGSSGGSSHSSNGGNGGGGGSPESAKNVKAKELCQVFITSGKAVKFDFTKNATAIVNLNFDAKKTVGKTTTIVEMLKNKSTLTPETPEGEVYNYLNIWVGNGGYGSNEENLENAVINFRVEKSWVQDKGIDQSSIVLNRYNEKKWNELTTCLSGEDDKYLYFKAESPGFSPFAITGKSTGNEAMTKTQPETEDNDKNTGSTAANNEQKTKNEENTGSLQKENEKAPGFEILYGILCLLGYFYIRKR